MGDPDASILWQRLLRWLVGDTPGRVVAGSSVETLTDDGRIRLTASVRGPDYMPAADAKVEAHVIGPEGMAALLEMRPTGDVPGNYVVDWNAEKSGAYLAEVTAEGGGTTGTGAVSKDVSRDMVAFQRTDGVAENFHTEQNREMLEKLSTETGGKYWKTDELSKLPQEISYSEAKDLSAGYEGLWNICRLYFCCCWRWW